MGFVIEDYLTQLNLKPCESVEKLQSSIIDALGTEKGKTIWDRLLVESESSKQEFYELKNSDYDVCMIFTGGFDYHIFTRMMNWIDKHSEHFKGEILDIGCDCGVMTCFLASRFPDCHITAIDRCESAIEIAKINAEKLGVRNIEFVHAAVQELSDNKYDTVFSMRTMQENRINEDKVGACEILSQQIELYKNASAEYAATIASLVKDNGYLITIERLGRDPFFMSWVYALNELDCGILLDTYKQIKCKEINKLSNFQAFVAQKGKKEKQDDIKQAVYDTIKFDFSKDKIFGWDALFHLDKIMTQLFDGYFVYNDDGGMVGQFSIFETNIEGERVFLNYPGNVKDLCLIIFQKEETTKWIEYMRFCVQYNVNDIGLSAKKNTIRKWD